MTKKDLINRVHQGLDSGRRGDKRQVEDVVNLTIAEIESAIRRERRFGLVGFGTFNVRTRRARMGVHPQTKKPIKIPATNTVTFKPSKELKRGL